MPQASADTPPPRIGIVSLGCAKALVDSERIISALRARGYAFAPDHAGADAVIVNTCGFLDSARAESLGAISEALAENGKVIVTGCLGAEPQALAEHAEKLIAITGPARVHEVISALEQAVPPPHDAKLDILPPGGLKLTPPHYAYLKISEGCSNKCTFCIIPRLRGPLASRPAADVRAEAEELAARGVKELLVVSQDTAAYGQDMRYAAGHWQGHPMRTHITDLVRELGGMFPWLRLHYLYPYPVIDELVQLMAEGIALPYLDVPFQHASPAVLKAMRRPANTEKTLEQIERWRAICPDVAIRSTFIVGFPGETEADFAELLDFLRTTRIDRVGCFVYEHVQGAAANDLPGAVPAEVAEERRAALMALQEEISAAKLAEKIGRRATVLVDEIDEENDLVVARAPWDAPEVDGMVLISREHVSNAAPGDFLEVRITAAETHDLWAEPVETAAANRGAGQT